MEPLLDLYRTGAPAQPYDERYPVVCFDERPCFLIGDVVKGLAPQSGRTAKQRYSSSKHGTAPAARQKKSTPNLCKH